MESDGQSLQQEYGDRHYHHVGAQLRLLELLRRQRWHQQQRYVFPSRRLQLTSLTRRRQHLCRSITGSVFADSGISDGCSNDVILNEIHRQNLTLWGDVWEWRRYNSQYYTQKESLASRNIALCNKCDCGLLKWRIYGKLVCFKIKIFIYINILCYIKGLKRYLVSSLDLTQSPFTYTNLIILCNIFAYHILFLHNPFR